MCIRDRYFINQTAGRILELTNTKLINYLGNYDYYEEKKEELTATFAPEIIKEKETKTVSNNKQEYLERKAEAARIRKLKNDISKVEEQINKYEDRLNEMCIRDRKSPPLLILPMTGAPCWQLPEKSDLSLPPVDIPYFLI